MYIVFDIGGTKMRVGASSDGETVQKITVLSTPATYEEGIEEFKKLLWRSLWVSRLMQLLAAYQECSAKKLEHS